MKKILTILVLVSVLQLYGNSQDEFVITIHDFTFSVSWGMQTECMELENISWFFELTGFAEQHYNALSRVKEKFQFECYYYETRQKFVLLQKQYNFAKGLYESTTTFIVENLLKVKAVLFDQMCGLIAERKDVSTVPAILNLYMVSISKNATAGAFIPRTEVYIGPQMGYLNNGDYLFAYYFTKEQAASFIMQADVSLYIINKKEFTVQNIDEFFFITPVH